MATGKSKKNYVKWFRDCRKDDFPEVGGKNANLGELIRAGFPVPAGFAVTVEAYKEILAQGNIEREIQDALFGLDLKDNESIEKAGRHIQSLIEALPMPPAVGDEVQSAYQTLCAESRLGDLPMAVRSSATAEDSPGASFAGQQDTYLWVKRGALVSSIIKCQASLFTFRSIAYRIRMGFLHDRVSIGVGVQKMVNARVAGVLFTLNPTTGDRSKIVIGGSWGLGDSVVSGEVTSDEWKVDKVVLEIIESTISPKNTERIVDANGKAIAVVDVPPGRRTIPCLTNEEVLELARVGKRIEQHYGSPQDIEWAIDRNLTFPQNVFILQARPETVWGAPKEQPRLKTSGNAAADVIQFWLNIKA